MTRRDQIVSQTDLPQWIASTATGACCCDASCCCAFAMPLVAGPLPFVAVALLAPCLPSLFELPSCLLLLGPCLLFLLPCDALYIRHDWALGLDAFVAQTLEPATPFVEGTRLDCRVSNARGIPVGSHRAGHCVNCRTVIGGHVILSTDSRSAFALISPGALDRGCRPRGVSPARSAPGHVRLAASTSPDAHVALQVPASLPRGGRLLGSGTHPPPPCPPGPLSYQGSMATGHT